MPLKLAYKKWFTWNYYIEITIHAFTLFTMTVLFTYFGVHILHTINRIQINPNNPGNVEDLQHSVEAHFMVFTISNITSFLYSYLFHLLLCYLILNFDSLFRLRYTVITIQTLTTFLHKRDIFHYNCGKRKKFLILPVFLSWKTHITL